MGKKIRSFVALNIPADARKAIGAFVDDLRGRIKGVRWVRPGHLHLTLKFLGDVDEAAVPAVGDAVSEAAAGVDSCRVTISGTGVFPPRGRPRVVWLDITEGAGPLGELQGTIEDALVPLGFAKEGRPFRPHLTVGRVKDLQDRTVLTRVLASEQERHWGDFRAEKIHLMRSELFPTGPRYSILREVRLRT